MGTKKYTHLAEISGVKCWYNEETGEVKGTNWLRERAIDFFLWLDLSLDINDGFYIKLIKRI